MESSIRLFRSASRASNIASGTDIMNFCIAVLISNPCVSLYILICIEIYLNITSYIYRYTGVMG